MEKNNLESPQIGPEGRPETLPIMGEVGAQLTPVTEMPVGISDLPEVVVETGPAAVATQDGTDSQGVSADPVGGAKALWYDAGKQGRLGTSFEYNRITEILRSLRRADRRNPR